MSFERQSHSDRTSVQDKPIESNPSLNLIDLHQSRKNSGQETSSDNGSASQHLPKMSFSFGKNNDATSANADQTTEASSSVAGAQARDYSNLPATLQTDFANVASAMQEFLTNMHAAETGVYQKDSNKSYGNSGSSGDSGSTDSGSSDTSSDVSGAGDSSSGDSGSTDPQTFMRELQSLMQYLGMGKNSSSDSCAESTGQSGDATQPTTSQYSGQTSGTATTGGGSLGAIADSSSSNTTDAAYNPSNDAAMQNLSNTYDSQLQNTLLNAYKDVQNGSLSQSGYNQFESASVALTDPNSDASKGIGFTTDTPLEQYALTGIQGNLSASDTSTLNQLIGADAAANPNGMMYTTATGSDNGGTSGGATGGGSEASGGSTTTGVSDTAGGSSVNGSDTNNGGGVSNGTAQISLQEMENQQNVADNPVKPGGPVANMGYGWYNGAQPNWPNPNMPANADSVVPWVDEYPINGTALTPGTSINVSNLNTYVLLKNGQWEQESTSNGNNGNWLETNPNNLQGILANPTMQYNADGSMNIPAAPDGQVNQFGSGGGTFNASDIQGIYVSGTVQGSSDDTNAVIQVGADFYTNGQYNQGAGTANWLPVTSKPQTFTYTNIPDSVLNGDPPPGVTA